MSRVKSSASPGEAGQNPPPLWFSDALHSDREHPGPRPALFSATLLRQLHNIFKAISIFFFFLLEPDPISEKKEFHSGIFFSYNHVF